MKTLEKILADDRIRENASIYIPAAFAWLLALLAIYGFGNYGFVIFFVIPIFIGFASTLILSFRTHPSKKECYKHAYLSLLVFSIGLVLFAIEGFICIIMAAPLGILFTWAGSVLAYGTHNKIEGRTPTVLGIAFLTAPVMLFIEHSANENFDLIPVSTTVEINAPPEMVWKNVVEFPALNEPTEFLFKAGIAYPVSAEIQGKGVGAVRSCNFSTGSFIEPITVWDEPRLLKFDVLDCPAPMKELSFWDVDAPHLHDYFVSKQGQFKLTELPNGKTLLEGTTWYYHRIRPVAYWKLWSDYIIHRIHTRVLNHIKANAESVASSE